MNSPHSQILVVDDDPAAVHAMRHLLADVGRLRFASSGGEALRLARAAPPDLVVLDYQMSDMTGLEVYAEMQRDDRLADVPVIIATAHDPLRLELAAVEQGAADFVQKPLVPETFRARVRARLRDHTRRQRPVATALAPAPAPGGSGPAAPPVLLIVDDDVGAVHALGHVLQDLGTIQFCIGGADALAQARATAPDLVLLDAHMPGLDGFEVCRAMKADPALRRVPIVFVTRYDDADWEARALDLGAADFVRKPFSSAVLQGRVRNLLELKRRADADLRALGERWRRLADARITEVVRTASDAIVACDAQGALVLANGAAAQLFGLPVEELLGRPIEELAPGASQSLGTAHRTPVRLEVPRRDADAVPVEMTAARAGGDDGEITTLVLRNLADRERLEAERIARAAAEASAEAKTRMIGVIAHEMGNPLNVLLGYAQLLMYDTHQPLHPRHAEWVRHMVQGGTALKRLLDDLLEFARHESGTLQVELEPVDLVRSAVAAVETFADRAAAAHVSLEGPRDLAPMHVRADPHRVHQCLANLISNAVKYSRRHGQVRVDVVAEPAGVRVDVRDEGMGLDERQLAALFEPFNRLGRERTATPGTGLGLVITRQLVQAMGGTLRVQSTPGAGSCFSMVLPHA
jgi:PAS domain S-box-containing protein